MGKKGGSAGVSKHTAKRAAQKAKKAGHFKALTKQETRQVVVHTEKKAGTVQRKVVAKGKKPTRTVPDEFRNFDERMAATRMKKQAARAAPAPVNPVVAAPSFVMAAPTFQFNAAAPVQEAPREVEGFHGFLSALQAPATAPQPSAPREPRKHQKIAAPRNVFAVLDDEAEPVAHQMPQPVPVPSFMQPATFAFHVNAPSGATSAGMPMGLTSLQRSLLGSSSTTPSPFGARRPVEAIDPDL